eukprot:gene8196-16851_t
MSDLLQLTEDELEAEAFLNRMDWDSEEQEGNVISYQPNGQIESQSYGIPANLQKRLAAETSSLNIEIIDFLLQWEEDDETESDFFVAVQSKIIPKNSSRHHQLSDVRPEISTSFQSDYSSDLQPIQSVHQSSLKSTEGQMSRDTSDLLLTLRKIDGELGLVEDWLGNQIERLSGIQSELQQIEAENNALESSWQNLSQLKVLANGIVQALSLTDEEENILRRPNSVIESSLKMVSLDDADSAITSLTNAINHLRRGISLKGGGSGDSNALLASVSASTTIDFNSGNGFEISSEQWSHIQSMVSVTQQRLHLLNIADIFCKSMNKTIPSLFRSLLQHRSLNDPNRSKSIHITKFVLTFPVDIFLNFEFKRERSRTSTGQPTSFLQKPSSSQPQSKLQNNNQLLDAQRVYHEALSTFLPVLMGYMDIIPLTSSTVSTALNDLRKQYIEDTCELFYQPLFKQLFKDLHSIISPSSSLSQSTHGRTASSLSLSLSLATLPRSSLKAANENIILLNHSQKNPQTSVNTTSRNSTSSSTSTSGMSLLTPWGAIAAVMRMCLPVIRREEDFLEACLFTTEDNSNEKKDGDNQENNHEIANTTLAGIITKTRAIEKLFESFMNQLLAVLGLCTAGSGAGTGQQVISGLEAVAVLTTLDLLVAADMQIVAAAVESRGEIAIDNEDGNFIMKMILKLKKVLIEKLDAFVVEQKTWMHHQRVDPKRAGLLLPVTRFAVCVDQVVEWAGYPATMPNYLDSFLGKLGNEILQHVEDIAVTNEKYSDFIRFQNYLFLVESFQCRTTSTATSPALLKVLSVCYSRCTLAEKNYVTWMLSYEFPKQSELASRMSGLVQRVGKDELGLYIQRHDVLVVSSLLETKAMETSVVNLRKRLEKHLSGSASIDLQELKLFERVWSSLNDQVISMVSMLQDTARSVYQIPGGVNIETLESLFEKNL